MTAENGLMESSASHAPRKVGRPKKPDAGVSHLKRPPLSARFPVHVVMRLRDDVGQWRSRACASELSLAFREGQERFGFRLVGHALRSHEIHLLVEASDAQSLRRGMQGLTIRVARALNRALGRHGKLFADRYQARSLRTPQEVTAVRDAMFAAAARDAQPRTALLKKAL